MREKQIVLLTLKYEDKCLLFSVTALCIQYMIFCDLKNVNSLGISKDGIS